MANRILDNQPPRDPPGPRGTPTPTPKPGSGAPAGVSPSLITSTGGLNGGAFVLMYPAFINTSSNYGFIQFDPFNFDTDEDCTYEFKTELGLLARNITTHHLVILYRDLGAVKFTANLEIYLRESDSFKVQSKEIKMGGSKDNKLHTKKVGFALTGERPKLSFTRKANDGPLSLIRVMLCATQSEEDII